MSKNKKEMQSNPPMAQLHEKLSNCSWANYLIRSGVVVFQLISLWIIYSIIIVINTKSYESYQPSALMFVIDKLGLSRLYDLRLMTAIVSHCRLLMISLFAAYVLSLAYLAINISKMKWNYKCLSAALWYNVLYESYNLLPFFSCNTSCFGRNFTDFRKNHYEFTVNKNEQRNVFYVGVVLPLIFLFICLYTIKLRSIKLAVAILLCSYLVTHWLFELVAIQLLKGTNHE
jgi:hypothetical protein